MSVGVLASAHWLPELAYGQVAGLAFFLVCGLLGAALGLVGVHVYSLVDELDNIGRFASSDVGNGELVAGVLRSAVFEAGSLVALAGVVYLLAPPSEVEEEPRGEQVAP